MVSIFPNLCLWRRSLRSNLGGIDLKKLYRATLSVITYKNCEMFLSAAFYYAAQSRNDTLIYNQLSPCGRDPSDTDTLIPRTVTRNTDV